MFWVLLYTTHGCIFRCEADELFSDDFTALAAGYEHNCLYLLHKYTVMNLNVTLRVNLQDSINEEGFSSGNFNLD